MNTHPKTTRGKPLPVSKFRINNPIIKAVNPIIPNKIINILKAIDFGVLAI